VRERVVVLFFFLLGIERKEKKREKKNKKLKMKNLTRQNYCILKGKRENLQKN